MRDLLLVLAIVTLLAALVRQHRKIRELRRRLKKASRRFLDL